MGFECYDGGMSFERDVEGDFKVQKLLCQPSINHELLIAQAETLLKKNAIYRKLEDLISRDTWRDERRKPQTHTDNEASQERQTRIQEEALRLEEEMKGRERDAVVNSLRFLGVFYNLSPQVFSSATYLFDSLTHQLKILPKFYNTMHLSCLHISLHMCYQAHLVPLDEAIRLTQADPILVQSTTSFIVSNFQCSDLPTPLSYLNLFLQLIFIEDFHVVNQCSSQVNQLLELVLCHHSFTKYRLDILVLSCCQQVLSNKCQLDKYNQVIKEIQYFCQMSTDEVDSCMRDIQVFKHHYYNHHHNNYNHKNFNMSDDMSLITNNNDNKNQPTNLNNNNNIEPSAQGVQSPDTQSTNAASPGSYVAPPAPQAPQCKLVWTVSKKLLSKMRPSSRAPNCLEALTEEEEGEDEDEGLVMSNDHSVEDGDYVGGDDDVSEDDSRSNDDGAKLQNNINEAEVPRNSIENDDDDDSKVALVQAGSGDDKGDVDYKDNVGGIHHENKEINSDGGSDDGDSVALKCLEKTGHSNDQHESFIPDDNNSNNNNNINNNDSNISNDDNNNIYDTGVDDIDDINVETHENILNCNDKAPAHPYSNIQSDFIIKCLLFLDFENLDNNDVMANKRFKNERYIHDRWMEERIKKKISKMNKMKFNDVINKENDTGVKEDKNEWSNDDVVVVMVEYSADDNDDEKMKKKKKRRKRKNRHKK